MINALTILAELDRRLDRRIDLTLYGRAAIQLGFENPPQDTMTSLDIDVVLWNQQTELLNDTTSFWGAVEETNKALSDSGLYISHFFAEDQVVLRADWKTMRRLVPIKLQNIDVFRLADIDLLLSKLMRDDPQDFQDALFIIKAGKIDKAAVEKALAKARIPDIPEIREEFQKASARLRAWSAQKG